MKKGKRKDFKKVLKCIKWENIYTILWFIFTILQLKHHITLNGLYYGLLLEIVINFMFLFTFRYIIKDIRKNTKEWTF